MPLLGRMIEANEHLREANRRLQGNWLEMKAEVDKLRAIIRVLVAANETRDGAIGLVTFELGEDHAAMRDDILPRRVEGT
jgi:hypothetical protein